MQELLLEACSEGRLSAVKHQVDHHVGCRPQCARSLTFHLLAAPSALAAPTSRRPSASGSKPLLSTPPPCAVRQAALPWRRNLCTHESHSTQGATIYENLYSIHQHQCMCVLCAA